MAEISPQVKVTLTAEDQGLSSALRQLSEQLKTVDRSQQQLGSGSARAAKEVKGNFTSISKAAEEMSNAVKLRLGNIPGLGSFGSMFSLRAYEPVGKLTEQLGTDLDDTFGAAGPLILGFTGALVGMGAAAALVAHHVMELAQSIQNTAAATGLSTNQVQEYTELAKEMDIDTGSLTEGFSRMREQLGEFVLTGRAAGSGSQMLIRALEKYNVALTGTDGKQRSVNAILADFYEQMQKIPDVVERGNIETAAFGERGGKVFLQLFQEAQNEGITLQQLMDEIHDSGIDLSASQLQEAEAEKLAWDKVGRSIHGAWTQLEGFYIDASSHPLKALSGFADELSGGEFAQAPAGVKVGPGGAMLGKPSAPKAKASETNPAPVVIAPDQKDLAKLGDQVAVLKAGGEEQYKLQQAEENYAGNVKQANAALKDGNKELAARFQNAAEGYKQEIDDLRTIIALESEKKGAHAASSAAKKQKREQEQNAELTRRMNENANEAIGAVLPRMGKEQARAQAKEREDEQRRLAFQEQLLEAEGKTFDAAILKIREEAEEYRRAGATAAEVNQFVEQKTAQAKFEAAAGSTQHAMKSFDVQKRGIELQGGKSGEAARTREVNALLSKQLPLLEEKADLEMQAALASGNLDDIARAQQDEQAVKNLKVQTKSLADQVKGPLQGAFTDFFSNLGKQGETARQSFAQLGASISEAFQRAFSQKLVAEVTGGGKSAGTSSSGGWGAGLSQLSSLMSLFHGGRSGSSSGGESSDTLAAMGSFGMSLGGHVRGAGTGTSDSIPAMLSHGEYVLNARATSAIGHENLDKINFSRHFAAGGYASVADFARPALHFAEGGMVPAPGEGGGSIDMHVGLDEGLVLRHLSSKGAGRVLLNHVATNPKAFHHALSRGR